MRLTSGGQALVSLFALVLIALGAYASTLHPRWQSKQADQTTGPAETPFAAVRLELAHAASAIEALDAEIAATEAALDVARQESAARTFSRKDDRDRVATLNLEVVKLRAKRAQAVCDYEAGVAASDSRATVGLPVFVQAGGR